MKFRVEVFQHPDSLGPVAQCDEMMNALRFNSNEDTSFRAYALLHLVESTALEYVETKGVTLPVTVHVKLTAAIAEE